MRNEEYGGGEIEVVMASAFRLTETQSCSLARVLMWCIYAEAFMLAAALWNYAPFDFRPAVPALVLLGCIVGRWYVIKTYNPVLPDEAFARLGSKDRAIGFVVLTLLFAGFCIMYKWPVQDARSLFDAVSAAVMITISCTFSLQVFYELMKAKSLGVDSSEFATGLAVRLLPLIWLMAVLMLAVSCRVLTGMSL